MDHRIEIVLLVMNDNLHKPAALEELAKLVHLSASGLRHLIRKETGQSPIQHLREMRMKKAIELLTSTWLSIDQIVLKVGWQDRSHFEREFKRLYVLTPVQFRRRQMVLSRQQNALEPDPPYNRRFGHI
jgi:transcriptional regulator GlxA family with amidase domain